VTLDVHPSPCAHLDGNRGRTATPHSKSMTAHLLRRVPKEILRKHAQTVYLSLLTVFFRVSSNTAGRSSCQFTYNRHDDDYRRRRRHTTPPKTARTRTTICIPQKHGHNHDLDHLCTCCMQRHDNGNDTRLQPTEVRQRQRRLPTATPR